MQIRRIALKTVDGLSPLPMSSAWVRDGLFVIGMDSEFAVYSQWRDEDISHDDSDIVDHRNLADSDLMTIAQVSTFCNYPQVLISINYFLKESSMRALRGDTSSATKSSLADVEKRKKGKFEPQFSFIQTSRSNRMQKSPEFDFGFLLTKSTIFLSFDLRVKHQYFHHQNQISQQSNNVCLHNTTHGYFLVS